MQKPVDIKAHNLDLSSEDRDFIHEKAAWLETFYSRIVGCQVFIDGPGSHHKSGSRHRVNIRLTVPDREITVSHQEDPSLRLAVTEAFSAARRLLQDYVRKRRGFTKRHASDEALREPPAEIA